MDTDVFIIGGGPAGLAAAIAARRQGLDVVVADGAQPPIDKACGEGLMPDGRAALEKLGVAIPAEDSLPFRGIRFVSGDVEVEANFPAGYGIGMRRTVLHSALITAAESAGASLLWRTPVTGLHPEGVIWATNACAHVGSSGPMADVRWCNGGQASTNIPGTPRGSHFAGTTALRRGATAWSCTGLRVARFTLLPSPRMRFALRSSHAIRICASTMRCRHFRDSPRG
jgi:hypothetical protein